MGVRIFPGRAEWAYGGFARFRRKLAEEEGIDIDAMVGYGGDIKWETSHGDPITPLAPLLNHSDCDGHLESHECELVMHRLRVILDRWAKASVSESMDYDLIQGRELLKALEHSAQHGCAVVFS